MKILQICHKVPFPPKDGGCIAMNLITEGLINAGHQLKVISFNQKKNFSANLPEDYVQKTNIETLFIDTAVNPLAAFINLFSKKSYNIQRFVKKDFQKLIINTLKNNHFDIIQLESIFVSPYLDTIRQFSNAPVVLRAHNIEHLIWERMAQSSSNPLKRAYLKLLAKRLKHYETLIIRKFDGIASISDIDAKWFVQNAPEIPVATFPVGTDSVIETTPDSYPPRTAFHLGSMDWLPNQEGVDWLINNVWPLVLLNIPEARLLLAGRNMPSKYFNLKNQGITIIGEVEDAKDFIIKSGIMLVPLLSGSGMRVKIIEGMAAGKAIVSTSIGAEGIPVVNDHNILIADEPEAFANHIIKLFNKPELIYQLSLNAASLAKEKLLNSNIILNLENFYKNLIASPNNIS